MSDPLLHPVNPTTWLDDPETWASRMSDLKRLMAEKLVLMSGEGHPYAPAVNVEDRVRERVIIHANSTAGTIDLSKIAAAPTRPPLPLWTTRTGDVLWFSEMSDNHIDYAISVIERQWAATRGTADRWRKTEHRMLVDERNRRGKKRKKSARPPDVEQQ